MTMSLYTTLPDDCIRVLSIKGTRLIDVPGSSFQDLAFVCELEAISLRDVETGSMQYSALSYVWGNVSPSFCRYILCNEQRVPVTMNLHNALRQIAFNSSLKLRRLWVDALCIDQDNVVEKSHQVGMMGEIYRNAEIVVVWMGNGSETNRDDLVIACESLTADPTFAFPLNPFFSGNEWFKRAWTFQEIILAQDAVVLVGPFMIPWQRLCECDPPDPLVSRIEDLRQKAKNARIADLLAASDGRRSRDPRDRIYSLLGIYHEEHKGRFIQPDYSKTVAEVFAEAAHQVILELGRLFFLDSFPEAPFNPPRQPGYYVELDETRAFSGLPWCPDWTDSHAGHSELSTIQKENLLEFKNLHPRFKIHAQLEGCRLQVAGSVLGYWAGTYDMTGMVGYGDFIGLPHCHGAVRLGDLLSGAVTNFGARIAQSKNSLRQLELFTDADETIQSIHRHAVRDCVCKHNHSLTTPVAGSTFSNMARQAWRYMGRTGPSTPDNAATISEETRDLRHRWPLLLCILFGAEAPVILIPVKQSASKPVSFRLSSRVNRPRSWTDNLLQLGVGHAHVVPGLVTQTYRELCDFSFLPTYFELE